MTPCQANPDDWFLERNGKQYDDEAAPTPDAKRELLARRRRAIEACHTDCRVRLPCLSLALDGQDPPLFGVWGGYDREQLAEIRAERDRRRLGS